MGAAGAARCLVAARALSEAAAALALVAAAGFAAMAASDDCRSSSISLLQSGQLEARPLCTIQPLIQLEWNR